MGIKLEPCVSIWGNNGMFTSGIKCGISLHYKEMERLRPDSVFANRFADVAFNNDYWLTKPNSGTRASGTVESMPP
ncbi:hypothetical protein CEXT_254761 [Caerostris extrusa]|uniref:Uncharacterized protein n=1 Tax=Caerostris extrusa TaxID=172846 RepID=A0AAV4PZN2_CAEEX|nr:hypothetical protein CEXT_254761 [Caerostris extrusa]